MCVCKYLTLQVVKEILEGRCSVQNLIDDVDSSGAASVMLGPAEHAIGMRLEALSPADAVVELFSAHQDLVTAPLGELSDELLLALVTTLIKRFPELELRGLPSFWQDATLLQRAIRGSGPELQITPDVLWFFRDYVNASSSEGVTPLLLVVSLPTTRPERATQLVNYLIFLGAALDTLDNSFHTAIDLVSLDNPALFLQLVQAGARGGPRTMSILKLLTVCVAKRTAEW